jgi:hypothetical protein
MQTTMKPFQCTASEPFSVAGVGGGTARDTDVDVKKIDKVSNMTELEKSDEPVKLPASCIFQLLGLLLFIAIFVSALLTPRADRADTYCETFGPEGSDAWSECAVNEILKWQQENPGEQLPSP